MLTKQFRKVSK